MDEQQEKRRFFLRLVTLLANLYLIAFSADAVLSVIDEALSGPAGVTVLSNTRTALANLVVLASLGMMLALLFVPHLPKRPFVLPVAFALWAALGAPPFLPTQGQWRLVLGLALGQVMVAGLAFAILKRRTGDWFLNTARLPVKDHLIVRTALSLSLLVFVFFPMIIGVLGFGGLAALFQQKTGNFVQFTLQGIEVSERIYQKGSKTVHLIGMIHFGEGSAYTALFNTLPDRSLILMEGVTDRDNLLTENLSYQRVARALGLQQQTLQAFMPSSPDGPQRKAGRRLRIDDGDDVQNRAVQEGARRAAARPTQAMAQQAASGVRFIPADVDISTFSPLTISFLNDAAALYDSQTLPQALERLSALEAKYTDKEITRVFDDIIYRRNDHVLKELDRRLAEYDVIVLPWGAMHMPGLEAALFDRGFVLVSETTMPLIRYRTLWNALTATL